MALAAARRPGLRRLLVGYFTYCLARKAARVVVVLYAFDLGGVSLASLVAVALLIPAALVAPLMSAVTERMVPARALTAGYGVQAGLLAAAGMCVMADGPVALTTALAALAGGAFTITRPVHLATLPDVVEHPHELTLGNAASNWVDGLASVAGPLLAGAGLAATGAGPVLIALGAACLVAAMASRNLISHPRATATVSAREKATAGFGELWRDRDLARLVGITATQYAVIGLLDVLLVVLVVDVLGQPSARVGLLTAAIGVGATIGGIISVSLTGGARVAPAIVLGAVLSGMPVALLGLAPGLPMAAVLITGLGMGKSVVTTSTQMLLQRTVPDEKSTRVFGVQEALIQAATAIGSAGGPLLLMAGPRPALAVSGALLPVAVLLGHGALSRLDSRAIVPGEAFQVLKRVPFLSLLPLRSLERLARHARTSQANAGDYVIQEGAAGDVFHVIESGSAEVSISGASARTLHPGEGFGEIALLRDIPRTASVRAVGELRTLTIDRDLFLSAVTGSDGSLIAAARAADDRLDDDQRRARTAPSGP